MEFSCSTQEYGGLKASRGRASESRVFNAKVVAFVVPGYLSTGFGDLTYVIHAWNVAHSVDCELGVVDRMKSEPI